MNSEQGDRITREDWQMVFLRMVCRFIATAITAVSAGVFWWPLLGIALVILASALQDEGWLRQHSEDIE